MSDNWIKAYREKFRGETLSDYGDEVTFDENQEMYQEMIDFISQVEKDARKEGYEEGWNNAVNMDEWETRLQDAIEKTNKRWREKIEGLKDECEFMESDAHDICQHCGKWKDEHFKQPGFNQALSTLLEDKQ